MLSKNAKKVLKIVQKSESYKIAYFDLKKQLGWDIDQVRSACNQLIMDDLAAEKSSIAIPGTPPSPWGIVLQEKGRYRWKYIMVDCAKFILKSIIVPVIVSALTTLITLLLTGFLN